MIDDSYLTLVEQGDLESLKEMLDDLRESNDLTKDDINILFYSACEHEMLDIIKFLVEECEADVRACNDLPLRWAADNANLIVMKYLYDHGADPDDTTNCLQKLLIGTKT